MRAHERLVADRDAPTPLTALVVRLLAPAVELWPAVNARRADGYEPLDEVHVAVAADGEVTVAHDAGHASLIELGELLGGEADGADGADGGGAPAEATIAVNHLIGTGVRSAAPALWADTAVTLAVGHPRDEFVPVEGRPRPVPTLTLGLTCASAVPMDTAVGFLAEVTTNLEDPILVFAD